MLGNVTFSSSYSTIVAFQIGQHSSASPAIKHPRQMLFFALVWGSTSSQGIKKPSNKTENGISPWHFDSTRKESDDTSHALPCSHSHVPFAVLFLEITNPAKNTKPVSRIPRLASLARSLPASSPLSLFTVI